MRFAHVGLTAAADALPRLRELYAGRLGIPATDDGERVALAIGETRLSFAPAEAGEPFHHVALLVPGDRFAAAAAWAAEAVELLPGPGGEATFDFPFWDALATYFHDPAGNIVELIAHRGIGEAGATGPFDARELVGVSEVGLVGDPAPMARALEERLGLRVWDGSVDRPGGLAFVGERARTLILARPGRGWLPTGRPAEAFPVTATVAGAAAGECRIPGAPYRIVGTPASSAGGPRV